VQEWVWNSHQSIPLGLIILAVATQAYHGKKAREIVEVKPGMKKLAGCNKAGERQKKTCASAQVGVIQVSSKLVLTPPINTSGTITVSAGEFA